VRQIYGSISGKQEKGTTMDINLADVTIHIDETLEPAKRHALVDQVREVNGVVGVGYHDDKPHLMIIEYDPDKTSSAELLQTVKAQGVHAELIGL